MFDEVVTIVENNFFDPELRGVDWNALIARHRVQYESVDSPRERSAAINNLLAHLETSHTEHIGPWDSHYYQLLGVFEAEGVQYPGIGIATKNLNGRTFIQSVLDGSPAQKSNLRTGDEIVAVNGRPFEDVDSFRDHVNDTIPVTIRREPNGPEQDIDVAVETIDAHSQFLDAMRSSARVIESDTKRIGYVHIWSYAGEIYQDLLRELLFRGPLQNADALVLDIRGGLGGASPDYLNIFNHAVPSLTYKSRDGRNMQFDTIWRKPVVLLIDEGSRSGKEVFAHGFKKARFGPVVGAKTAGAVVGGRPFKLSDGTILYLAVSDVLVDGVRLEGVGVEPDVAVAFELPYANGADPQIDRAVEEAAKLVQSQSHAHP